MTDEYNENGKGSKAEGLKKSFGSGQIPTQATFSELIDLADVGRKTLGFNEGDFTQPPQPGSGLTVPDVNHPLQVNIAADKSGGLKFNEVTHALELTVDDKQSGLVLEKDKGLMVKPGLGIRVEESGVAVKAAPDGGLDPTDDGLRVKLGAGLIVEKANEPIKLHIAEKGGLSLIEPNATNQLSVKVNQDKGLDIDPTGGVQLKADMGWFEFKDKQLKFTDMQLTKFKEAAVQAGSGALGKAVSGTSTGFRRNSNPNPSKLEQDIAKALNDAYEEGLNPMQAWIALTNFFKEFCKDSKNQFKGSIALSPQANDTRLYGDNCKPFQKNNLFIVDPNELSFTASPEEEIVNLHNGIYGIYGMVDSDGNPCFSGTSSNFTQYALLVLVSSGNFAAILGKWDLGYNKWDEGVDFWSSIPTPDPLQYKKGYEAAYCETVKPDVRETSLSIFAKAQPVNLRQLAQVSPSGGGELCFTKGNTPDNEWESIVADLSRNGDITLRSAGHIAVLVQELTQDPKLLSRAVQLEVQVGIFGARGVDCLKGADGSFVSFEYSTDESGAKVTITAREIPRKFFVARPAQDDFSTTTGEFKLVVGSVQAKPKLFSNSSVPVVIKAEDDPNGRGGRSSRLTFEVSSGNVDTSPDDNQPGSSLPDNSGSGWPGNQGSGWPGNQGSGWPGNQGSGWPGHHGSSLLGHPGSGWPGHHGSDWPGHPDWPGNDQPQPFDTEWWTLDLPNGPYKIAEYTDTDGVRCQVFLAQE
ncbi:hypothetical protein [Mycetohabitans rhizoxinica]|uniref:Uncharacterized protein n=1 Tax=Mycetohabitans rhizoxinica TaxID=412963 RepID=A0ABZ2PZQ6_9BURK